MRLLHSSTVSTAALKQDLALDAGATVLNHSMNLVQRMESLLAMGNGSDVTLRVHTINTDEVKVIQAHSLVLTMQSDVFEELLLTRNNSIVVLRETSDCAAVFDKFIRYGWRAPRWHDPVSYTTPRYLLAIHICVFPFARMQRSGFLDLLKLHLQCETTG